MRLEINTLKRTISALGLCALMLVGAGSNAFAHRTGFKHNHGRHLGWERRDDNRDRRLSRRDFRTHRRSERRALLEHQRSERRDVRLSGGDFRTLSQHQRAERRDLRQHQREERNLFKSNRGHGGGGGGRGRH